MSLLLIILGRLVWLKKLVQKFRVQFQISKVNILHWKVRCRGITVSLKCIRSRQFFDFLPLMIWGKWIYHTRKLTQVKDLNYQIGNIDWKIQGKVAPLVVKLKLRRRIVWRRLKIQGQHECLDSWLFAILIQWFAGFQRIRLVWIHLLGSFVLRRHAGVASSKTCSWVELTIR